MASASSTAPAPSLLSMPNDRCVPGQRASPTSSYSSFRPSPPGLVFELWSEQYAEGRWNTISASGGALPDYDRAVNVDPRSSPELYDLPSYLAASPDRRRALADAVVAVLGPDWTSGEQIVHRPTGLEFCIVPGGTLSLEAKGSSPKVARG